MSDAGPARPDWTVRVVVVVVGLAIVALLAVAISSGETGGPVAGRNDAIEALIPAPGSQQPRQSSVGVDLKPGWTADLEIFGRPIPRDQIEGFDPALGRTNEPRGLVLFDPGPGKEFADLPQDQICVTATLRQLDGDGVGVETWCFDAV